MKLGNRQPFPGGFKIGPEVILPIHNVGVVVDSFPVAVDKIGDHAEDGRPEVVDQHVEHCLR